MAEYPDTTRSVFVRPNPRRGKNNAKWLSQPVNSTKAIPADVEVSLNPHKELHTTWAVAVGLSFQLINR